MANYYHVRILLLSGTALEAQTCYKLTNVFRNLEKWTGQSWPDQIIRRALKAEGCWAHAYTQPEAGDRKAGTFHVARRVVVSIEDAGTSPEYFLKGADYTYYATQQDNPAAVLARLGGPADVRPPLADYPAVLQWYKGCTEYWSEAWDLAHPAYVKPAKIAPRDEATVGMPPLF